MFLGLCWDQWAVISGVVTASAATIALFLGVPTWISSRRALKREIVNDLFKEYSTEEIGQAVKALHDAFRKSTGKNVDDRVTWDDKREWINHYKKLYRKKDYRLHYKRRIVSSFYQRITFSAKGRYVRRIMLEMWGERNHPFIMNLLLPIETVAMPELIGNKIINDEIPIFNYKYPMWLMWKLWKHEQPIQWWRIRTNIQRLIWKVRQNRRDRGK